MNRASSESLDLELVIDASGAATGADQFDQAVDRVGQGAAEAVSEVERLERSTGVVGVTMTRVSGPTRKMETDLNRLRRQIDPTWASQDKMRRATDLLDRSLRTGLITEQEKIDRLRQLEQRFGATATATTRAAAANDNMVQTTSRFGSVADIARRQLIGLGAVMATAFSGRAIMGAADAYTRFSNSLRVAGVAASNMAEVEDRLFAAANRNGAEIEAVSTLYSRASIAAAELGTNQEDLLRFIDGTTAALRVQGGSSASASGALLQLSQALGSGVVRTEEFNSILEGAFPIAQAAARGIDGMGGSVAKLRQAIVDGDITSKVFFEGLLKGFTATEAQAAGMSLTVGNSLTVLNNSFTRFVGRLDESTGLSVGLSSAIVMLGVGMDALAENLDVITVVATTAGGALVAMFGPAVLASVVSFTAATGGAVTALRALGAAVVANPLGLLITAIGAAIGLLIVYRSETIKVGDATVQVGKLATAQFRSMIEVVKSAALIMSEFAFAVWKGLTGDFSGAGASFSKIADEAASASARIRDIWTNLGPDTVDVADEIAKAMGAAGAATGKLGEDSKRGAAAVKALNAEIERSRGVVDNAQKALQAYSLSLSDDMTKALAPWAEQAVALKSVIDSNVLSANEMAEAHRLLARVIEAGEDVYAKAKDAVTKFGDELVRQPELLREEIAALEHSSSAHDALLDARDANADAMAYEAELIEAMNRGYDLTLDKIADLVAEYRTLQGQVVETQASRRAADREAEENTRFLSRTTQNFFSDLRNGLDQGKSVWSAFADAATRAIDRVVDKLMDDMIDAIFEVNNAAAGGGSKGGGGFLGGLLSAVGGAVGGIFGGGGSFIPAGSPGLGMGAGGLPAIYARGGAFNRGMEITPFANGGIVDRPTLFPMAKGMGLMGEAGPEAVMPLTRGPSGHLGVRALSAPRAAESSSSQPAEINLTVNVNGARGDTEIREMARAGAAEAIARATPSIVKQSTAATRNRFTRERLIPVR